MKMGLPGMGNRGPRLDLGRRGDRGGNRLERAHGIHGVDEVRRPDAGTDLREIPERVLDRE